ncbi:MAG: YeeE/YedE thiosulfate transporter family protein [Desulfobacterales bacterium]
MTFLRKKRWSPYAVGAAIGALETVAMLTAKRPLGITTAFEDTAAMAAEKIAPEKMTVDEYREARGEAPKIDWEMGLVGGVLLGSLLSSRLSNDREPPAVPGIWREKVGRSRTLRYASAVGGGALMMFGSRMAKGCTSGHGISGTMQFAASSWLFDPIMFASGAAVSKLLFGRGK